MSVPRGVDVDIVTGKPLSQVKQERKHELLRTAEEAKHKAMQIVNDLSTPMGKELMNLVYEGLVNRINFLVKEDTECQVYVEILRKLKQEIDVAPRIAELSIRNYIG